MPDSTRKPAADPLHAFNFVVSFQTSPQGSRATTGGASGGGSQVEIAQGAFSEISGLEATVEPFAINEGGRNWGQIQRVGRTTFATVVLRRGMTRSRQLWQWFQGIHGQGRSAWRLDVTIQLRGADGNGVVEWKLKRALPVKMKLADLNAAGQEVAIEELHLVHEGITEEIVPASSPAGGDDASRRTA